MLKTALVAADLPRVRTRPIAAVIVAGKLEMVNLIALARAMPEGDDKTVLTFAGNAAGAVVIDEPFAAFAARIGVMEAESVEAAQEEVDAAKAADTEAAKEPDQVIIPGPVPVTEPQHSQQDPAQDAPPSPAPADPPVVMAPATVDGEPTTTTDA